MGTWCWLAGGEGGNRVFDPLLRTTGGTLAQSGSRLYLIALCCLHPCVSPDAHPVLSFPVPPYSFQASHSSKGVFDEVRSHSIPLDVSKPGPYSHLPRRS